MKPPSSGPTAAAIAAAAPTSAYALRCIGALEVAVDERLHRRQQQRRAEPADDRPADDDRQQALRERHRERADRVAEQAEHVRALAADQVADLAADQDERGRHERLERDRRLHAARRRVEVAGRPPRSRRSSATCRRRGRTSPSRAGSRGSGRRSTLAAARLRPRRSCADPTRLRASVRPRRRSNQKALRCASAGASLGHPYRETRVSRFRSMGNAEPEQRLGSAVSRHPESEHAHCGSGAVASLR